MKELNEKELYQKRQMQIANTLYELGVEDDVITAITKIEMDQVLRFRNEKESSKHTSLDSSNKKDI